MWILLWIGIALYPFVKLLSIMAVGIYEFILDKINKNTEQEIHWEDLVDDDYS